MKKPGQNPDRIIPKDLRKLARTARRAGWTITAARSGHLHWRAPDGRLVVTGTTPSRGGLRLARNELTHELEAGS